MELIATSVTPMIKFDLEKGLLEIRGKSYPEDVREVYNELLDLITKYAESPQPSTLITFEWLYYNTATSKVIAKILLACKEIKTDLSVKWVCKPEFTLMIENGEFYKEHLEIDFEIVLVQ